MSSDNLIGFRLDQLTQKVEKLEEELDQARKEAVAREHKRLVWGIGTLGTIVTTLGGIIWAYRSVIFK